MQKNRFVAKKLAPVTIAGVGIMVNLASIDKNARTVHHGEFEGTKVNSPATLDIGESVAIWADADKMPSLTMSQAAFGLTAKQYLESKGYTVTKKT